MINRDYNTEFWLSPEVSTLLSAREQISSWADNGRGLNLILGVIFVTKILCYNMFITYSSSLFLNALDVQKCK